MSSVEASVSDMLITVKSREVQRAMLAEMQGNRAVSNRHFLAAAHLELVLADDYGGAGEGELAIRSRISAASCFWRGEQAIQGRKILQSILMDDPSRSTEVQEIIDDLEKKYPDI